MSTWHCNDRLCRIIIIEPRRNVELTAEIDTPLISVCRRKVLFRHVRVVALTHLTVSDRTVCFRAITCKPLKLEELKALILFCLIEIAVELHCRLVRVAPLL